VEKRERLRTLLIVGNAGMLDQPSGKENILSLQRKKDLKEELEG